MKDVISILRLGISARFTLDNPPTSLSKEQQDHLAEIEDYRKTLNDMWNAALSECEQTLRTCKEHTDSTDEILIPANSFNNFKHCAALIRFHKEHYSKFYSLLSEWHEITEDP